MRDNVNVQLWLSCVLLCPVLVLMITLVLVVIEVVIVVLVVLVLTGRWQDKHFSLVLCLGEEKKKGSDLHYNDTLHYRVLLSEQ